MITYPDSIDNWSFQLKPDNSIELVAWSSSEKTNDSLTLRVKVTAIFAFHDDNDSNWIFYTANDGYDYLEIDNVEKSFNPREFASSLDKSIWMPTYKMLPDVDDSAFAGRATQPFIDEYMTVSVGTMF